MHVTSTYILKSNLKPLISEDEFKIEQNYIALFKPVSLNAQNASYILAITRLGDVIDPEWFSSRHSIRDIEITDSGYRLKNYYKESTKTPKDLIKENKLK